MSVFDLINYSDSGMYLYIDNPMESTLHEVGILNMSFLMSIAMLSWRNFKLASHVVNCFCGVCVT